MDMKQSFNHFAIQFLSAILLGLLLVALHSRILGGFFAIFVPKFASPWELSKLIYWPMLGSVLFTRQAKTSAWEPGRAAACLVLTPMALFLLCWCLSLLNLSSGVYVLLWILVIGGGMLAATMGDADPANCLRLARTGSWHWPMLYVDISLYAAGNGPVF